MVPSAEELGQGRPDHGAIVRRDAAVAIDVLQNVVPHAEGRLVSPVPLRCCLGVKAIDLRLILGDTLGPEALNHADGFPLDDQILHLAVQVGPVQLQDLVLV